MRSRSRAGRCASTRRSTARSSSGWRTGALTGADIREVVHDRGLPESEVGGTLALLVASGYAIPALPDRGAVRSSRRRG